MVSVSLTLVTVDLHYITLPVKSGKESAGTLLMDTTFVSNLDKSMEKIKNRTKVFEADMEALKHNILLRNYFKKKEKAKATKK
jgi:phospholipid/cholesterol/gamma-HCH transport system substrate-binding protein